MIGKQTIWTAPYGDGHAVGPEANEAFAERYAKIEAENAERLRVAEIDALLRERQHTAALRQAAAKRVQAVRGTTVVARLQRERLHEKKQRLDAALAAIDASLVARGHSHQKGAT